MEIKMPDLVLHRAYVHNGWKISQAYRIQQATYFTVESYCKAVY